MCRGVRFWVLGAIIWEIWPKYLRKRRKKPPKNGEKILEKAGKITRKSWRNCGQGSRDCGSQAGFVGAGPSSLGQEITG
jgi:hypothetical protein